MKKELTTYQWGSGSDRPDGTVSGTWLLDAPKQVMDTITTRHKHVCQLGDLITIESLDPRWWMRLWRRMTFRSPMKKQNARITGVSGTVISVSKR